MTSAPPPPPAASPAVEPNPFDDFGPFGAATSSAAVVVAPPAPPAPAAVARASSSSSSSSARADILASFDPLSPHAVADGGGRKRAGRAGRHRQTQSLCTPSEFAAAAAVARPPSPSMGLETPPPPPASTSSAPSTPPPPPPASVQAELSSLASALSWAKPRALNETERAEESAMNARLTLGENPSQSTGTKKSHRRKPSLEKWGRSIMGHGHRRAATLDVASLGSLMNDINKNAVGGTTEDGPGTPEGGSRGCRSASVSPKDGGTPKNRRGGKGGGNNHSGGSGSGKGGRPRLSTIASGRIKVEDLPSPPALEVPDLTANAQSGSFASACSYSATAPLWSSEQEPSAHQVDIPTIDDFLLHARCCNVLEDYRVVDQNFDFSALAGMSRLRLRQFVDPALGAGGNDEADAAGGGLDLSDRGNRSERGAVLIPEVHSPIVSSVLNCADDLVVEGFFHEAGGATSIDMSDHGDAEDDTGTGRDKANDDRVEVAIFSSQHLRQFVVVWRGTSADQAKPVRNRQLKAWKELPKGSTEGDLHPEQPVAVFPPFKRSYFSTGLEGRVFKLLDELSDRSPFCDVVMAGHSFGGALATIAAMRFASSRNMMRVMCQVFGSPKVGGTGFGRLVNSLPNLKVMRVEHGSDPWVSSPEGHAWTHVGHTVVVDSSVVSYKAKPDKDGESSREETSSLTRAYRFDGHRPPGGWLAKVAAGVGGHHLSKVEKADRELRAYVGALDRISSLGLPWPRDYVGKAARCSNAAS